MVPGRFLPGRQEELDGKPFPTPVRWTPSQGSDGAITPEPVEEPHVDPLGSSAH